MIKLPIHNSFDQQQVIGWAELDETKLPGAPNWHLALGYLDMGDGTYQLRTLGLVPDHKFKPVLWLP